MPARLSSEPVKKPRLLGSNKKAITVGKDAEATKIRLSAAAPSARGARAAADESRRIYVFLENVKGTTPSSALTVYVGLPARNARAEPQRELVKTVVLFGLGKASVGAASGHEGDGLSIAIDATDAVQKLTGSADALPTDLEVTIQQERPLAGSDVTVGKVSVVSQVDE